MSALLWALIALPLTVGTLLTAAGRHADRAAPAVGVACAAVTLGLAIAVALRHPTAQAPLLEDLPVRLAVDGLSGLMAVTVAAITAAVLLFSVGDIGRGESRARFFGLMLLFSGSMLTTVTAASLPVLLMAWEVMGATSWALIGFWWRDPARGHAANTAFLTTRAADLGLYLAAGAALASGQANTLALNELAHTADPWLSAITAGVIVAALGKSAQLPFSFWLSSAMQGPSPVSALLHSATMVVAGAYLLLRLEPLLSASGWGGPVVAWTGAVTAVLLGLVAVAQTDLKQLLAASSCAQIGFMVLAAGTGAVTGGTVQLMAHAAAKSLAFLVAGAWLTALGAKTLRALRGAARGYRTAGIAFTVSALTLAGIPPLSLWAAKDLLLAGALKESVWLYAVGLAAGVISAVYAVKALWFVWRPTPVSGSRLPHSEPPPLLLLAVACVGLTALALPPAREAVARVLRTTAEPAPLAWEFVLSGGLALLASAVVWTRGAPAIGAPWRDWLRLEAAARLLLVRPTIRAAHALAVFDDRVLDRTIDAAAHSALSLARWTDRRVEAGVDAAVEGVASTTRALGRWARRPQSGQLHQYLAQAVAAFTVLAIALVFVR
ncbi:NADH-quinone oxidoreductase subunit L [Streptomyces albipurpureus]|uniref:NADH-quinone oxidoreductase subunit L n=1 Tax=Streptomyces albipurpureus TaxID=2897419 RepID=A0ABT0UM85_9ACTN|nr:proton-conducting transporter membrane subunit [Streptomyces sp. CWNU-1]MCM2389749.1 NADH-quinone oxidoreductase subunit L [Streptomyces sp. CWNU-1]